MEKQTTKYVAYLRVSTQKQGYSGLGLESQKEIIRNIKITNQDQERDVSK